MMDKAEYQRKWRKTEKGKASVRQSNASEGQRLSNKLYRQSKKGREASRRSSQKYMINPKQVEKWANKMAAFIESRESFQYDHFADRLD